MKSPKVILWIVLSLAAAALWLVKSDAPQRWHANRIIASIEEHRLREGSLPDPANHPQMTSLGFELRAGWHPDYQPLDASNYQITIMENFEGPYWIYQSKSRQWLRGYLPVGLEGIHRH